MKMFLNIACIGLAASALVSSAIASTTPEQCQLQTAESACSNADLPNAEVMDQFLDALRVLQDDYFELWLGTWPKAIDWTAAVMSTHVAGALKSLSTGLAGHDDARAKENLITTYFSQLLSYYFGQDAFAIRNEAYDDILWVVLGWLELIQFIDYHTTIYHQASESDQSMAAAGVNPNQDISEILQNQTWYGNLWTPAFSHRARVFWDLSSRGWNTTLCGGGMVWNPRLEPYKNSITNELYIAASASMYLYFPGDPNTSPFANPPGQEDQPGSGDTTDQSNSDQPHEQKHLQAALDGYNWLMNSSMRNNQGLFIDGFHISGWQNSSNPNTECDIANSMVYTYNQGVVLTGQVGLWKVTGDKRFLDEGHTLVENVIRATGYDLASDQPVDNVAQLKPGELPPWHGIGRAGVLEEQCDISGQCSQDGQTFKGIFFHHLTAFCAPLDLMSATSNATMSSNQTFEDHRSSCASYVGWIRHNALAALGTKDRDGKFGMWWTAGLLQITTPSLLALTPDIPADENSVDYRTYGVPKDDVWVSASDLAAPVRDDQGGRYEQAPLAGGSARRAAGARRQRRNLPRTLPGDPTDPNMRGRGRTVETQGGGLAVLRALWEISTQTQG